MAVAAALSMGAGAVSAKSNNAAVKAAGKKCTVKVNSNLDFSEGKNAGWLAQRLACADANPLKAKGKAITIGFISVEGPIYNFPEYRISAEAAVSFINEELGGIGANVATGKPGRPLKLEICKDNPLVPTERLGCANTLAAKKLPLVISALAFSEEHFGVFDKRKIPLIVGTPIMPKDFTATKGAVAIGGGGGCLGVHLGLITYATQYLLKGKLGKAKGGKVAVPWAESPPGIFCFHDLEAKPMDVLAGKTQSGTPITSSAALKGTMPDLTYKAWPISVTKADISAEVAQLLAFKPDVMVYSNQGSFCWAMINEMIKQGWKNTDFPVILSGACIDPPTMTKLGAAIKGIYTIGGLSILDPDALSGLAKTMSLNYSAKMAKYSSDAKQNQKGFATQGYAVLLNVWMMMDLAGGQKATGAQVLEGFKKTSNHVSFGATGLNCADAIAPYYAVCSTEVSASKWDGTALQAELGAQDFSGLVLVGKGDALRFSEVK